MKVVLFWLGLTLAALTVEGRDSMIVSDIPNREPKDIKDNNNNHNNNENNDQPTVHKSNDVYPSRPQHMPPPTSHQHRVATFMHVQNRPANRHLTMRNDLTKPQSSTEELSEGGPAAYEHRFKRVFHHSENSSLPAHSSSINLEILRINLFNESMTQRNDAINRIYCDKTVTEERLALFEECQIKPPVSDGVLGHKSV